MNNLLWSKKKHGVFFIVPEQTFGVETVCFIGDNFMARTYRTHFKKQNPTGADAFFIKENYEFAGFCNSHFHGSQTNILARLQNTMVAAINSSKNGMLPKYFIIVLDEDLVSFLDCNTQIEGITTILGTWIQWLAKEFTSSVNQRMVKLPIKCKKFEPFFYWVAAPIHSFFTQESNQQRIKFNLALDSVVRTFPNMRIIRMKSFWDSKDSKLVINNRMTETGLTNYWASVDATFRFNVLKREAFLAKQVSTGKGNSSTSIDPGVKSDLQQDERHEPKRFREDPMSSFLGGLSLHLNHLIA